MNTKEPTTKKRYRKDKPWQTDDINCWDKDKWNPDFKEKDYPHGLVEKSEFATLFPKYREEYIKEIWPEVKKLLGSQKLKVDLDLLKGQMSVATTNQTRDPFIILKARDMLQLLARSVPLHKAKDVLNDDVFSDIINIGRFMQNKDRFVKRRQRLVGPHGSTLKAIELLTKCFVLVQGNTVATIGSVHGIKKVRRVVEDCMKNIHPVYHVKELMIRKELEKNPELKDKSWDNFLPHFKKKNIKKKVKKVIKPKSKSLFPPEQTPRKEDIAMERGEYFVNEASKAYSKHKKSKKRGSEQQE